MRWSLRDAVAQANAILNADIPLRRAAEGQTLTTATACS